MGVGHIAVALGASRAAPRVNVGWFVFAALLSDFLLGIFAWMGLEHSTAPEDYASRHYLLFTFPYSHGLVPLLLWAAIFGLLVAAVYRFDRSRIGLVVAALVLSHFVLDGMVHVAGLPLAGENSPKFGLGLWNHMTLELLLETAMAIAGIAIYWRIAGTGKSVLSRYGMAIFMLLVTAMTWTQLLLTVPPPQQQLTTSWIIVPLLFAAIAYALDRRRVRFAAPA